MKYPICSALPSKLRSLHVAVTCNLRGIHRRILNSKGWFWNLYGSKGNGGGKCSSRKHVSDEGFPSHRFSSLSLWLKEWMTTSQTRNISEELNNFLILYILTFWIGGIQFNAYPVHARVAEFSTSRGKIETDSVQNSSAFISETVKPAVVLLSFLGAKQRQLKKYADIYFAKGYDVYVIFNNLPTAIFPSATQRQAQKVLEILEKIPEGQPVFVHAISIGTGVWGLVLEEFRRNNKRLEHLKQKISGVIYDSGPSCVSPGVIANGLYSACPKLSKKVWNMIATVTFALTRAEPKFRVGEMALRNHQVEQAPQLYLYSRDDHVINSLHESIQQFIEKNKQRGVEVYQKVWEKSEHATHLKLHPEEYMKSVEMFINRCLQLRDRVNRNLSSLQVPVH